MMVKMLADCPERHFGRREELTGGLIRLDGFLGSKQCRSISLSIAWVLFLGATCTRKINVASPAVA